MTITKTSCVMEALSESERFEAGVIPHDPPIELIQAMSEMVCAPYLS
jgi:hypothetical protein